MGSTERSIASDGPRLVLRQEEELFAAFVADLRARGRADKTIDCYRSDWQGLCEWWQETHRTPFCAAALDGDAAARFKARLAERGMTPATINRKLVFLKRYTTFARERGLVDETVQRGVRAIGAEPDEQRGPRGLSDLELRRFLKEVEVRGSARDQAIVFTVLHTGLRVSELAELCREQITLGPRTGQIHLEDARGRTRRLPVGPIARKKLRAWLDERGDGDGPLFVGERGPLTTNAVQRLVRKYCEFARVRVSPQVLRHTFATGYLLEHDGDLVGLADTLGHECLETTRLYVATAAGEASAPVRRRTPVLLAGREG